MLSAEANMATWTRASLYTDPLCTTKYEPNWGAPAGSDHFMVESDVPQDVCTILPQSDQKPESVVAKKYTWIDDSTFEAGMYSDTDCTAKVEDASFTLEVCTP